MYAVAQEHSPSSPVERESESKDPMAQLQTGLPYLFFSHATKGNLRKNSPGHARNCLGLIERIVVNLYRERAHRGGEAQHEGGFLRAVTSRDS